jgi:predicted CopG family antitoxin
MARTVMLSEAAYNTLKAAKKEGESFSDVVLRLASGKGNMHRILEAMKKSFTAQSWSAMSKKQAGSLERTSNYVMLSSDLGIVCFDRFSDHTF